MRDVPIGIEKMETFISYGLSSPDRATGTHPSMIDARKNRESQKKQFIWTADDAPKRAIMVLTRECPGRRKPFIIFRPFYHSTMDGRDTGIFSDDGG